jgi:uncharacterized protein
MKALHMVTFLLLVVGGLNWGIYAVSGWEIGQLFGGMEATVSKVIYILVGLSAIATLATHKKDCKMCDKSTTVAKPAV